MVFCLLAIRSGPRRAGAGGCEAGPGQRGSRDVGGAVRSPLGIFPRIRDALAFEVTATYIRDLGGEGVETEQQQSASMVTADGKAVVTASASAARSRPARRQITAQKLEQIRQDGQKNSQRWVIRANSLELS